MSWSCQCLKLGLHCRCMLCCFFPHRPLYASDEILIQPYFTTSEVTKLRCFNIGAAMVLEHVGSSQIPRTGFFVNLHCPNHSVPLWSTGLREAAHLFCSAGVEECLPWHPVFLCIQALNHHFHRQPLKLSGILLVRSSHKENKIFKPTTRQLVYQAINLTGSYSMPFCVTKNLLCLSVHVCRSHGQCCIGPVSCFKQAHAYHRGLFTSQGRETTLQQGDAQ